MRDKFSTLDIVKALEIPRERLREWMNRGFIKPSEPARGQGTKAVFTRIDVYGVALFRHLLTKGFKREIASEYVQAVILHDSACIASLKEGVQTVFFTFSPGYPYPRTDFLYGKNPSSLQAVGKAAGERFKEDNSSVWDYIIVINLAWLKKETDAALLTLE